MVAAARVLHGIPWRDCSFMIYTMANASKRRSKMGDETQEAIQLVQPALWPQGIGVVFDGFAVTFFVVTLALLFMKKPAANAVTSAVLAAFCAVMGSPDRFQSLTFSVTNGIQVVANKAIERVEVKMIQLQRLAATVAVGSFNDLAFSGQVFIGMSTREKFRVHDAMVDRLHSLGVGDADIKKTQHLWTYVYCGILEGMILYRAKPSPDALMSEALQLPKDADMDPLPTPETLRVFVSSKFTKDPEIEEILSEYTNVWTTGRMKNPDLISLGASPNWSTALKLPASADFLKSDTGAFGAYSNGGLVAVNPPR